MDIELAQTLAENKLLKSLLYCTKRSCNNCGKVTCENFQRQRIDCCGNWVSYKDYIKQLEEEKDKAWWEGFDTCKAKAGEANVKLSDEINLLKAQIKKMKVKWHDLEKDPNDLPKDYKTMCICLSDFGSKYQPVPQVCIGYCDSLGWSDYMGSSLYSTVRYWCELPK